MSRVPTPNIDYTSRDYEAFRELMIDKLQETMPEYTDLTETDAGIVIIEALANGLDILSLYADIVANDVILSTTQSRRLAILLARCLGYTPYHSTPSEYEQVFVLSEVQEEDYQIPEGTVVKTEEDDDLDTIYFETVEDLIIPAGKLGNEQSDGEYLYTVRVRAGESVYDDVVGSSTGVPLQSFTLNYEDVLIDSLELYVDEGNGDELWSRVDSFFECDENSKAYMVYIDDLDQCIIQFGNGVKGKIPLSFPNGITANYRIGGGEASNVNAGEINTIETGMPFVDETFNLGIAVRGIDNESIDSIKVNAPAAFRSRDRLVTLQDYVDLLKINFYPIQDVVAVKDNSDSMLVHLFYLMREDYTFTADLATEIATFIGARSMVGTTYDINPYVSEAVNITATLYTTTDYDSTDIISDINDYLSTDTFNPEFLSFRDTIVKSDLENDIKEAFDGVLAFRISTPSDAIISPSYPQNILTLGTISISVVNL